MTATPPNLLRVLLNERHLQSHRAFCREYDKQAVHIDPSLVGTYPSRAQFYRWVSGEIAGLPYPDHCQVLEAIFRGHTATALFNIVEKSGGPGQQARSSAPIERVAAVLQGDLGASDFETLWTSDRLDTTHWRSGPGVPGALPLRVTELDKGSGCDLLAARFITTANVLRLTHEEAIKVAHLHGNMVELALSVFLDIQSDGWAKVTYQHTILNMSARPLSRLTREAWFENTLGPIEIHAVSGGGHTVSVERIHDTKSLAKFACIMDPPVAPGAHANITYTCRGGRFVADHYWRQLFPRYTRWATIQVRHWGASPLSAVSVSEEHSDGSVSSADKCLYWEYDGADVAMTVVRDYLCPNQAITLRWERSGGRHGPTR